MPRQIISLKRRYVYGLLILFLSVAGFSIWLIWTSFAAIRFRDSLIDREYEGSLSTHLGFLVALTSEASQSKGPLSAADKQQSDNLKAQLQSIQGRLANLQPLHSATSPHREPLRLEAMTDTAALLRLIGDPRLGELSLDELGLRSGVSTDFPNYPFLESSGSTNGTTSFVFIPSSGVETDGPNTSLSPKMRRELVFSKIAEQELRPLLAQTLERRRISQAYYISCYDFVRLFFFQPKNDLGPYRGFWPLRSFVDRSYFRGARDSNNGLRVSAPYLDVTGGGFVRTYSAFVHNRKLGLCGMLALDIDQQPLERFWNEVNLGTQSGGLQDFTFGTYSLPERKIQQLGAYSKKFRRDLAKGLVAKEIDLPSGIQRLQVEDAKIFTVPMGEKKIGLFVFDAQAMRFKYWTIVTLGLGAIVSFVSMLSITTRKYRAAALAELRQVEILENLHGGFVIVNPHGEILEANSRFWDMVGSQRTQGKIDRFLSPESAAEFRKPLEEDKGFEFAGTLVTADRKNQPVIIASAPLSFSGWEDSRMLILIPSQKFETAIANKFLNIFSHALKSPVHSILLIADLFRRRNALSRFDEYFSLLRRKVEEFRNLMDNILRFSALDVKDIHLDLHSVNIAQILRRVLSAARERAQAQGLVLHEGIPENLRTQADEGLVQIVLNNLFDNALKYTLEGYISVHARDLLTKIQVVVEDSGPGVPEADRERIFELFTQGSQAHAASHEGLGLGLYISRRYIEAMGGTLRYEPVFKANMASGPDEALRGSRFIIELPKISGGTAGGKDDGQEAKDFAT